jgi:excisionase family DNA binding protein
MAHLLMGGAEQRRGRAPLRLITVPVVPTPTSDTFLTVHEVAELLKLNQQTVRNWIDAGSLPAVRVGSRRVRIKRSDLDRFIAAGTATTTDAANAFWSGDVAGAGATRPGDPALWERFGAAASRLAEAVPPSDPGELAAALGELGDASKALGESIARDAAD